LEYFSGPRRRRVAGYREFVEGKLAERKKIEALPVLKQAFIGDEEFVEEARRKAAKPLDSNRIYPLKKIVQAVCKSSGMPEEEIRRPGRSHEVKSAREILCYVARRHGDVTLGELARFLGVKELSTPSHGVRRAEQRMSQEPEFRRQLERVLKILSRSSIQA
jgi:chromosomal replication initiation ATPase DnaA